MKLKKTAAAATLVAALAGGALALAPAALADPAGFSGCATGSTSPSGDPTVLPDSCRVQEYYSGGRKIGEVTITWFQGRRLESDGCRTFTEGGRVVGTSCRTWTNA